MNSEEDKMKVLDNLRNLKDNESVKQLGVTDDYPVGERYLLKEYSLKAKEMNDKESPDCKYVWRVRGTPKKRAGREEVNEAEISDSSKLKLIKFDEAINHKRENSINESMAQMTSENFSIDYSVRGTAKCKRCKNKMDKNVLRFGKRVIFKSSYIQQYFHVDCGFEIFKKARVPTTVFGSLNELKGFSQISSPDKDYVTRRFQNEIVSMEFAIPRTSQNASTTTKFQSP